MMGRVDILKGAQNWLCCPFKQEREKTNMSWGEIVKFELNGPRLSSQSQN